MGLAISPVLLARCYQPGAISPGSQLDLDERVPRGGPPSRVVGGHPRRRRSGQRSTMSASWHDDDEDFKIGGRAGIKSKPRFSFTEVKMLLDAVKRNRYIILSE